MSNSDQQREAFATTIDELKAEGWYSPEAGWWKHPALKDIFDTESAYRSSKHSKSIAGYRCALSTFPTLGAKNFETLKGQCPMKTYQMGFYDAVQLNKESRKRMAERLAALPRSEDVRILDKVAAEYIKAEPMQSLPQKDQTLNRTYDSEFFVRVKDEMIYGYYSASCNKIEPHHTCVTTPPSPPRSEFNDYMTDSLSDSPTVVVRDHREQLVTGVANHPQSVAPIMDEPFDSFWDNIPPELKCDPYEIAVLAWNESRNTPRMTEEEFLRLAHNAYDGNALKRCSGMYASESGMKAVCDALIAKGVIVEGK